MQASRESGDASIWREFGTRDDVQISRTVAEIAAQGVALTTAEALAIVQSLIETPSDADARPPYGPPLPENILIGIDGSVRSRSCAVTPTVLELAILLDRLLPAARPQVPAALRYTLWRALHEVAAPPFDSLDTFSQALQRFESGVRSEIVRGVLVRAAARESGAVAPRLVFGLPFAAAVLAGLALIGAGESMRGSRPAPAKAQAAEQELTLSGVRPIVLNPPPVAVRVTESGFRRLSVPPLQPPRHRIVANRAPKQPEQQRRRLSAPLRIIPGVRIRFDEL